MKAIINATLVMRDHYIVDAYLLIGDDGMIADYGMMRDRQLPEGIETIDAEGWFVGPGFVDIHSHAGGKHPFAEEPAAAARHHLEHGTTSVLATLGYSMRLPDYLRSLPEIEALMQTEEGCNIAGVYMEGPYINTNFGSHKFDMPWSKPLDPQDYLPIIEAGKRIVRAWTVAPEREGILDFVKAVKKEIPDVSFTVGHSEATAEQIEELIPYGLCLGTHHTNATGTIIRYPECRGICVDETVNYNDAIYAEMICDENGIHVDPYMLRLVRKIKGPDRLILISDATAHDVPKPEHGYEYVTDLNFDIEGEIAGSKLTLDMATRNMMKHTGASIVDVFKYASYNPSRAVKLFDRGEIYPGKRADLTVVDYKMNVKKVFVRGEQKI